MVCHRNSSSYFIVFRCMSLIAFVFRRRISSMDLFVDQAGPSMAMGCLVDQAGPGMPMDYVYHNIIGHYFIYS